FAVVAFVASFAAFVIGLHWGIVGVATCYAVATTLIQPFYTWLTARAAGLTLFTVIRSFSGIAQATVLMALCVVATRMFLVHEGVPAAGRLAICCLVGIAVFVPLCMWRAPELRRDVRGLARRRRVGSATREGAPAGAPG